MSKRFESTSWGHTAALVTILIWGTTFVSTKVLLHSFTPVEILFFRFVIGFVALIIFYPRRLKVTERKREWYFIAAGVSGITFYYLLENVALTLTTASNVGVIVTVAPFFTALLSSLFLKEEKPRVTFYVGFLIALGGIALISYNGSTSWELNPMGDVLAVAAAFVWAVYSILIRKISEFGYSTVQTTRRVFFWGLIGMIPFLFLMDFHVNFDQFASTVNVANLLFLGLGASAFCFVTWNMAVKILGAVKTSVYIYLVPIVNVIFSVLILSEPLTPALIIGAALTLVGLWLSERKPRALLHDSVEIEQSQIQPK